MLKRRCTSEEHSAKRAKRSTTPVSNRKIEHIDESTDIAHVQSPRSSNRQGIRKRKHEQKAACGTDEPAQERPSKRLNKDRLSVEEAPSADKRADPVSQWVDSGYWSGADMSEPRQRSMKRTWSTSSQTDSYNRQAGNGVVPRAWSRQHAQYMEDAGIHMGVRGGATIIEKDQQLWEQILKHECTVPDEWCYKEENFSKLLLRVRCRNEPRVERDLWRNLSPSAELLHGQGVPGLDFVGEGTNAEWSRTTRLHGPKPKPDATYSLSRSSFTSKELEKLTSHNTAMCEDSIFPFYVRQAKSIEGSLEQAELQALHNTSVAANTIVELHQSIPGGASDLQQRILAFSIVHNHHMVRWFAHFVVFEKGTTTFHRQLMSEMDLNSKHADFTRAFKITVGICTLFGAKHRQRVKDALAQLPERAVESFAASLGLEDDSAGTAISTPSSSQEDGRPKRPSLSVTGRIQEENEKLREQIETLMQRLEHQLEQSRQETREQLEQQRLESQKQLEQQRLESQKQLEQQRLESQKQLEQQRLESRHQLDQLRQEFREREDKWLEMLRSSKASIVQSDGEELSHQN